jgi:CMP-N,N'-diacetyllegionaminic acid synthase
VNILGVIPARGGSKEIPRKNLLKIGGKTLVELAILSAKESRLLTRFILSTDDNEILNLGINAGCESPFIRPKELSEDKSSSFSVLKHAVHWLNEKESWQADIAVLLQPTTPFRRGIHIDTVLDLMLKLNADAAMAIRKPDYPAHWMLEMTKEKKIFNLIKNGNQHLRRQDTPEVYQPAGMVYAIRRDLLLSMDNTLLPIEHTVGHVVDQRVAINIDTELDYQLALKIWEILIAENTLY